MTFRKITINDYGDLVSFWKENYFVNEMDNLERFKLYLDMNPGLGLLAKDNEKIAGTILGAFDGRRGYLQKLVVDKAFRRKGIGKQLVEKTIAKFKALGCTYITLNVEAKLVGFYEECGFKKTQQVAMNMEIM